MPRLTILDTQWQRLMALCESESRLRRDGGHPRLLKLIASDILQLAGEMGFPQGRIESRDFRSVREDGHIVGIVVE